jgi:hypothetical protein
MTALLRALAVAVGLALTAMVVTVAPASASPSPGPTIRHLSMKWLPGVGAVRVTAMATCEKGVSKASWGVGLWQDSGHASRNVSLRCDGRAHRVHLKLDPKKGRLTPGSAAFTQSSMGCSHDMCWVSIADGWTTIRRHGNAQGPRGER